MPYVSEIDLQNICGARIDDDGYHGEKGCICEKLQAAITLATKQSVNYWRYDVLVNDYAGIIEQMNGFAERGMMLMGPAVALGGDQWTVTMQRHETLPKEPADAD